MRRRSKKRHNVPMPNAAPLAESATLISANVMSGAASTKLRIAAAWASIRADRRSPPCGFGRASPCSRTRLRQRIALDALTPKCAAAWRHDMPPAIAARTRLRRSIDSACAMPCRPPAPAGTVNQIVADSGITADSVRSEDALAALAQYVERVPGDHQLLVGRY